LHFLNFILAVNFATCYKCFRLPTAVDVAVAAVTLLLLFQLFSVEVAVAACCTATAVGLRCCAIAPALVSVGYYHCRRLIVFEILKNAVV